MDCRNPAANTNQPNPTQPTIITNTPQSRDNWVYNSVYPCHLAGVLKKNIGDFFSTHKYSHVIFFGCLLRDFPCIVPTLTQRKIQNLSTSKVKGKSLASKVTWMKMRGHGPHKTRRKLSIQITGIPGYEYYCPLK